MDLLKKNSTIICIFLVYLKFETFFFLFTRDFILIHFFVDAVQRCRNNEMEMEWIEEFTAWISE